MNLLIQQNCTERYLDKTLSSQNLRKYYIVVNASVNDRKGEVVVLNYSLYKLLKEKDSALSDINNYKVFIKGKILKKEFLNLKKGELDILNTDILKIDSEVMQWAKKGDKEFISHFFYVSAQYNYARLNNDVPAEYIPTIVKILFKKNYFLSNIEGRLVIEELDFCKKNI